MRSVAHYLIGLLFGLGISVSGMINPAKVLNFFDIAGHWDPSLALVMGGALAVALPGYRLVLRRRQPLLAPEFRLPPAQSADLRLVAGSAVFGVGWGLAGFCPGGALPALGSGRGEVLLFVAALLVGMVLARIWTRPSGQTTTRRAF
ncbi:MAG: YeeE/YedE family protein [Rhodospirillales bacterium]